MGHGADTTPSTSQSAGAEEIAAAPEINPLEEPGAGPVGRLSPATQFEVEFRVPDGVRDVEGFKTWASRERSNTLAHIETFLKEGMNLEGWKSLSPLEQTTLKFSVFLISEEAISNLISYGVAGLNSRQREVLYENRTSPDRDDAFSIITRGIENGSIYGQYARIKIEFGAGALTMRVSDSRGFPNFEEKLAEAKAKLASPEPDEFTTGRGLMLTLGYFDEVYQDKATGDRIYRKSMDQVQDTLERIARHTADSPLKNVG